MSSVDEFDDSLDEILANITSSQLDPSLKRQTDGSQRTNSCETQTDISYIDFLDTTPKRKLVIIETDKHHHKPCVYHNDSTSQTTKPQNKRFKSESIQTEAIETDFSDINDENGLVDNQLVTHSPQMVLFTNEELENWSQTQSDPTVDGKKDLLTQHSLLLLDETFGDSSDSESHTNTNSVVRFEADDEFDLQRSPLLVLDNYATNERPVLRPSQDMALLKTQNSQNSNSSQNSSILSF